MEMMVWGLKVGEHLMMEPPSAMESVSSSSSMWADSSFLPPWRAISTEKVRPEALRTLCTTALATSCWYGRSLTLPHPSHAQALSSCMLSAYHPYT